MNDQEKLQQANREIELLKSKLAEYENHVSNESRLQNLLNSQTSYVLRTDLEGKYTYLNPKFREDFGWVFEQPGVIPGDSLSTIAAHHHDRTREVVIRCIENPGRIEKVELDKITREGKFASSLWEFVCLTDANNVPVEMQCMGIDITDRKKAELEIIELNRNLEKRIAERTRDLENSNIQFEKAKTEAEQANLAKSEFLSRMSHEFRTPLNSILGFGQLLEMGNLDEKQHNRVKNIMKSGRHLLDLINEILDIAKIEAGKISLVPEFIEIKPVLRELVESFQPMATANQITIICDEDYPDRIGVQADRQRFKQVLINLISNGIKYNRKGGTLSVKVEPWSMTGDSPSRVKIHFRDTGEGIGKEKIGLLFTPFERLNAGKRQIEGTGLGLAIVKKIMNLMDGNVDVESTPGQGSDFWIDLPCEKSNKANNGSLSDQMGLTDFNRQLTGTIIYFEDNQINIELVEQFLDNFRSGLHLISITDGENAISKVLEVNPDLIMLDMNLPEIHGSEILHSLKNHDKTNEIPVVIISADALPHQIEKMLNAGAAHYLTKPLEVKDFLAVIDQFFS